MRFNFTDNEVRISQDLFCMYINDFFNNLRAKKVIPLIIMHSLNRTKFESELFEKLDGVKIKYHVIDRDIKEKDIFMKDKFHWNKHGNKIIAKRILDFLEEI